MKSASSRLLQGMAMTALLTFGLPFTACAQEEKVVPPVPKVAEPPFTIPAVFEKETPTGVEDLRVMEKHVKEILKKVMPATVGLQVGAGSGSGIIISEDGYVLTAGHVSGTPDRNCTIIMPDGKRLKGKTLGYNKSIDSGLIKILDKGKYPFVGLAESSKLKTGQWCVTLGHPGGFRPGRTPVLRLGRVLMARKNRIRTDCALVGGDSGGPLFDLTGRIIGIHTSISTDITENMHVPVDTYRETWDRLAAGEEWGGLFDFGGGRRRSPVVLGLSFSENGTDLKVEKITKDGPAEKADFKEGDIVTAIDGMKLKNRADLQAYLMKKKVGDEVKVEIQREDDKQTITLKLGKRPNS